MMFVTRTDRVYRSKRIGIRKLNKKARIKFVMAMFMLIANAPFSVNASTLVVAHEIKVILDGKKLIFKDQSPIMSNNSVLVPIRVVSESLGATIGGSGKNIVIARGDTVINLIIGSKQASVGSSNLALNMEPVVKNGRTLVPLRFVSEALGIEVKIIESPAYAGFKTEPAAKFAKYFKSSPDMLDEETVTIVSKNDFPLNFEVTGNQTSIMSVWIEKIGTMPVVKANYTGKHFGMAFLSDDGIVRFRWDYENLRIKEKDGSYTATYYLRSGADELKGDKDWRKFDSSKIKYVWLGIGLPDTVPLMTNPFQ